MTHTFRSALIGTVLIPSMLLAQTAFAQYVTPEEALSGAGFSPLSNQFMNQMVSPRNAVDYVNAQQSSAAALRRAEQEAAFAAQHPAAPTQAATSSSPTTAEPKTQIEQLTDLIKAIQGLNTAADATARIKRDQRILDRVAVSQQATVTQIPGMRAGESLHSGAPLSDSGPATWIVGALLGLAALWTMRHVKALEQAEQRQE